MKPWLVGEHNPYGPDERFALYPNPPGCAGWRLCHKVLRMDEREYLRSFERRNLLATLRWSAPAARDAARAMLQAAAGAPMVLLGARVAAAFGHEFVPFARLDGLQGARVLLPHPSGRSRGWNDPASYARAHDLVRSIL